jgi:hypothetical protein
MSIVSPRNALVDIGHKNDFKVLKLNKKMGSDSDGIGTDQNRGIYLYKRKGHLPRASVLRDLENLKSIGN